MGGSALPRRLDTEKQDHRTQVRQESRKLGALRPCVWARVNAFKTHLPKRVNARTHPRIRTRRCVGIALGRPRTSCTSQPDSHRAPATAHAPTHEQDMTTRRTPRKAPSMRCERRGAPHSQVVFTRAARRVTRHLHPHESRHMHRHIHTDRHWPSAQLSVSVKTSHVFTDTLAS